MVKIPILRWGQPYHSLEVDNVVDIVTGETLTLDGTNRAAMRVTIASRR